ncbi:ArsR/SmtB family transcription factor [Brevibacterium metallidurans]|uniref:HTH arsR-type domain-containing protein n=1 Tax=Brevibacterium metallidurans TaxID=1482676 RepID=A0ABP3C3K1_9MICO
MAKYSDELSEIFTALADPTRRAVVDRLGRGPATISELAAPLSISLPSFLKHVRTLEDCGLIRTRKTGRVRTCVLDERRLGLIDQWLDVQRRSWEAATDRLDAFVTAEPQATRTSPASPATPAAPASPAIPPMPSPLLTDTPDH